MRNCVLTLSTRTFQLRDLAIPSRAVCGPAGNATHLVSGKSAVRPPFDNIATATWSSHCGGRLWNARLVGRGFASERGETLFVRDRYVRSHDADQTSIAQVTELPAHVFTGETKVSTELPLRHRQFQPHAGLTRAPVLFRKSQKSPCGAPLHLQSIVLDDRRRRSQLFTQDLNDFEKRLRMRRQGGQQVARVDREDLAWFKGDRIGRASLTIQRGNLTVEIAGTEEIQDHFLRIGRRVHHLGAAGKHDHQAISGVTTPTDDFALGKAPRMTSANQAIESSVGQASKEGIGPQEWSNSRSKFK
jgi:hypothetical protein